MLSMYTNINLKCEWCNSDIQYNLFYIYLIHKRYVILPPNHWYGALGAQHTSMFIYTLVR